MNRFLVVVVVLVVCVGGLAYYRGWFQVSTEGSDHATDVTVTVDKDKIRGDEDKVKKSVHDLGTKSTGKTGEAVASPEQKL